MKNLFFAFCAAVASMGAVSAQDNLLEFFPNEEGTRIISKCYDGNDVLQGTMTMTVLKNYEYTEDQELDLAYVITDASGATVNSGKLEAEYVNGAFMLNMKSNALSPTIGQCISMVTELSGDFLDYPNLYANPMLLETDFEMDGGSFTIASAETKRPVAKVNKYGRQIMGTEQVSTPAGTFDATKITFSLDVEVDGEKNEYHGVKWYSAGAGIVRSEVYDRNNNLQDYTLLTDVIKPRR